MICFLTMDGAWKKALYNSWLFIFSEQWKHKHVFISIFIPKCFDGISKFKMLCTQNQAGTNHVFYLVPSHEVKVVKSGILEEGPVPKKAKVDFSTTIKPSIFMVKSMVTKYVVIKDVIHTIKGFNTTILAHFKWEMYLSWAIDRNLIKHDLLLGLSNFVVNCFSF